MDGLVRHSSRRAHPFFALFSLSLFSFIAFFSLPAVHVHYSRRDWQPFPRAAEDSPLPSIPPSNSTVAIAGLPSSLPTPTPTPTSSTPSSSSVSSTSFSSTSTTTTSSTTSTTTTILTPPISAPRPLSTLTTPTTTTLTSSTVSTPASSSATTYSLISDVTPSGTFNISPDDPSTSTTVVSSTDPSSTVALSSKPSSASTFWDNKGAVAATFLFISLLALAFAIMITMTILKRRKARKEALIDSEFIPNYQEPKSPVHSLAPSITSTPLDPFKSRDVVHDHMPTDIPASLPPTNSLGRDVPSVYLAPPSAFSGLSRYLLPSELQPTTTKAAGQRNKSEMRVSTQSGYQPSFDSFYGAYD